MVARIRCSAQLQCLNEHSDTRQGCSEIMAHFRDEFGLQFGKACFTLDVSKSGYDARYHREHETQYQHAEYEVLNRASEHQNQHANREKQ